MRRRSSRSSVSWARGREELEPRQRVADLVRDARQHEAQLLVPTLDSGPHALHCARQAADFVLPPQFKGPMHHATLNAQGAPAEDLEARRNPLGQAPTDQGSECRGGQRKGHDRHPQSAQRFKVVFRDSQDEEVLTRAQKDDTVPIVASVRLEPGCRCGARFVRLLNLPRDHVRLDPAQALQDRDRIRRVGRHQRPHLHVARLPPENVGAVHDSRVDHLPQPVLKLDPLGRRILSLFQKKQHVIGPKQRLARDRAGRQQLPVELLLQRVPRRIPGQQPAQGTDQYREGHEECGESVSQGHGRALRLAGLAVRG